MQRAPIDEEPFRVVVADRHEGMREALRSVLASHGGFHVIEAVDDLLAAGKAARAHLAHGLVVEVALLESGRLSLGPLPAVTTVVAVGMDDSPQAAAHARRHGAGAYVVKDRAHLMLPDALLARRSSSGVRAPGAGGGALGAGTRRGDRRHDGGPVAW